MTEKSLIAKIRRSLKRRESCVVDWRVFRNMVEYPWELPDFVDQISKRVGRGCDWMIQADGETRFFEGN